MKKVFLMGIISLAATMAFTSCAKDEILDSVPQQSAIEFSTYLGRNAVSKGAITENDGFAQFGVFAFYTKEKTWATAKADHTPNFMYNQEVNKSGNTWSYTPKKYWPATQGEMISFFAYAPMASNTNGIAISANNVAGTPKITYTIDAANLENMADLVTDVIIDEKKVANSSLDDDNKDVSFKLNHELTRVNITAKLSADAFGSDAANKTKVNITNIELQGAGFATSGVYTFADANDASADNVTRGTWEITGNSNLDIFDTDANFINHAVDTDLNGAGYTTSGVAVPTTTPVSLFVDDQYLFLIPANGTTGIDANSKVELVISYDIVTIDANLATGYSISQAKKIVEVPAAGLKQGVAYNFALTFGLNEVVLSATVADWEVAGNDLTGDVDYPKEDAQ